MLAWAGFHYLVIGRVIEGFFEVRILALIYIAVLENFVFRESHIQVSTLCGVVGLLL